MKKSNSTPSFYIDTTIPSKKGYKFFIFNLLKSLSIFCIGVGILIGIVFAVLFFFKSKIHPQFDINLVLYIAAICLGVGLIFGLTSIILSHKFKKLVKKLYEEYYASFSNFKPTSFQIENQSFYYIDNNTLHIHQNLEEVYSIDLTLIKEMELNTKLSKVKPFSKVMFKKKMKRRFTCIGVIISPFEGEQFIVAINLLLANYSLQTSKKKFKSKYIFSLDALNKLILDFNKFKDNKDINKDKLIESTKDQKKEEIKDNPSSIQESKKEENKEIKLDSKENKAEENKANKQTKEVKLEGNKKESKEIKLDSKENKNKDSKLETKKEKDIVPPAKEAKTVRTNKAPSKTNSAKSSKNK